MGVVAEGGYGTGVNPNGVYFPFISEVSGAERLFADMYLGHRVKTAVLPLRVTVISGFTQPVTTSRAEMTIVDASGSVVFNSTSAGEYRGVNWGGRFRIHEWISDEAVLRVVQHTGQNDTEDVIVYPSSQTLSNAVLDERASELWPDEVLTFIVNGYPIKGDVEFVGGYNFETKLNSINRSSGKPHVNKVYVSAEAGSGLGREEGCVGTTDYPIRSINGVKPKTDGSFIMSATNCLFFVKPGQVVPQNGNNHINYQFTNGLLLKNSCLPCCSCDDFVNTYQGIRRLYDTYTALGTRATTVRNQHASNVSRWGDQKSCRESDPVKINIMPFKVSDVYGFKIGVGVCNIEPGCRGELTLDLNFEAPNGLRGYINKDTLFAYSGSGYSPEEYQVLGDWPNYQVKWLNARGQSLSKLKLDIAFARTPSVSSVTWEGTTELLDESGETVLSLSTMTIPSGPSRIIVNRFSALNSDKTKEYGYRVNDTVHVESYNVLVNLEQGIFKPTSLVAGQNARIAFKLLNSITSTSMKPFALQPHITSVENDPSKLRRLLLTVPSGIQGNPYVKFDGKLRMRDGMLIMPAYSPGIRSDDYVKLTATAKLNGETIPNGVKTVTRSLKV
jgi:hypothetical protein